MSQIRIPFNRPVRLPGMEQRLADALAGTQLSGLGPTNLACERHLTRMLGKPTLLCTSATHALEMAALLLNLGPGDEVILPSYTFVSTANAFMLRGCKLRFWDNDTRGNMQLPKVTPQTKAIVVVHYGGTSCDMDALLALGIPVIEDAAQAIGGTYKGRPLGTLGVLGALSFHDTKNISAGEGGALIVNDPALLARAEIIREKGTNRRQFVQGIADKYTWVDVGSSYVLSDLNAAYLLPQLEQFAQIQARRGAICERYHLELTPLFDKLGARVLDTPDHNTPNHHVFAVVWRTGEERTRFIARMRERGVVTPFHYVSLHASPMGKQVHDGRPLPNCERLSDCLVRLPLYYNLSEQDQSDVIAAVAATLQA